MGRVLLEAMACRKPIIASRVEGIPHYISDGENGLLFESESVDDLACKLRLLLRDRKLAAQLADNGHRLVHENLSETCFLEKFNAMMRSVLSTSTDGAG